MITVLSKEVINTKNTRELGLRIKKIWSHFDLKSFEMEIATSLPQQKLGERIQQVKRSLRKHLPDDYEESLNILLNALPPRVQSNSLNALDLASDNGFIIVSLTSFVAHYGINHYPWSMRALKEMTQCFSAEGSIRYFIRKYPKQTLQTFHQWALDSSPHVRRLVSESTRPRLPMTQSLPQFKKDPSEVIKLLTLLKDDSELFVRRSVANNLNDISKDNPNVVTETLKEWNKNKSKEMRWLTKHALRTLEKQGNREALELLGYKQHLNLIVSNFKVSNPQIHLGDTLEISAQLTSAETRCENIVIDIIIFHMKANGKLSPKVFKWFKKKIKANECLNLVKRHAVRFISTRKYYSGRHEIHLQINGKCYGKLVFNLTV